MSEFLTEIKDQLLANLTNQANTFQKEILDTIKDVNNKLPEEIFVGVFLPYFSGEVQSTHDNNLVANWISVAGSPMASVDIIDNSGTKLYTVPPIMDTSIIDISNRNKTISFKDILVQAEVNGRNIKGDGERFALKEFSEKADSIILSKEVSEKEAEWVAILSRYGKAANITKANTTNKTTDSIEEFFE